MVDPDYMALNMMSFEPVGGICEDGTSQFLRMELGGFVGDAPQVWTVVIHPKHIARFTKAFLTAAMTFRQANCGFRQEGSPKYFDRAGKPIDAGEWGRLGDDQEYSTVRTDQRSGYRVATIWTGHDTTLTGTPESPHIFETMMYTMHGRPMGFGPDLVFHARYPTEAAAIAGHDQALAWLNEWLVQRYGPRKQEG
jgi:hypothetical protein